MAAMLDKNSSEYFRQRERAERKAAKRAVSEAAKRIHRELARSYAKLVSGVSTETHL
jgi:hypothetical protein